MPTPANIRYLSITDEDDGGTLSTILDHAGNLRAGPGLDAACEFFGIEQLDQPGIDELLDALDEAEARHRPSMIQVVAAWPAKFASTVKIISAIRQAA